MATPQTIKPKLPPGFVLDEPSVSLPPGFVLDASTAAVPVPAAEAEKPGFLKTVGSDVMSMLASAPVEGLKMLVDPVGSIRQMGALKDLLLEEDPRRKKQGRSLAYRLTAGAGSLVAGVPAGAMEQSAEEGDPGGVLGHAALPAALALSAPLMTRGGAKASDFLKGKIPSTLRAGAKFQEVMGAAEKVPVDVAAPGDSALRAQQLAESGGSMPKVVRDFVRRVTDPNKPPLTYKEARDFYSNASRLSADEFNRLTPVMKRQVSEFTKNLGTSIEEAAKSVGKEVQFRKAMQEYRNAMKLKAMGQRSLEIAAKYLPWLAGGLVAKEFIEGK